MNPIRPESQPAQPRLGSDWHLAIVDPEDEQPGEDEYGHGTLHCTLLIPSDDWVESGAYQQSTIKKFKYCRPWAGTPEELGTGVRVWVREYYGFHVIMLAEC
jgi:hypothetical protein